MLLRFCFFSPPPLAGGAKRCAHKSSPPWSGDKATALRSTLAEIGSVLRRTRGGRTERLRLSSQDVGAGLGNLGVLRRDGAGDSDRAYDPAIGRHERYAALKRGNVLERQQALSGAAPRGGRVEGLY